MKKRFSLLLAVAGALAATALSFGAGAAGAATTVNCPGDDLQTAIDNASQGATITINGTCYGNFTVNGANANNFGELTLQGGSAGATLNGRGNGPTLTLVDLADAAVRNLTITNGNPSGIQVQGAELIMTNATVKGNRAFQGGGIAVDNGVASLTGVTVTRNRAEYQGGGIFALNSFLSTTASTVSLNSETGSGNAYGGGGIWLGGSDVVLTSTKVTSNTSSDYGGGIADYGGHVRGGARPFDGVVLPSPGLKLVNSSVDHNTAEDDGGGIYNTSEQGDSPVELQGSKVSFNVASDGDGGGIYNYGENDATASILATGSTFQGNQARNGDGGAVFNGAIVMNGSGTALVTVGGSSASNGPNVVNSNQARRGGGFANDQGTGFASLSLQPGAKVSGNKASVTGGGVWNNCGSFSSLGQILLNTPNNVVNTCIVPV